jgi:deoxyribodipyrimidine photo-lyase
VKEGPVIPVYILDDAAPKQWKIGAAQRWWLHYSLKSLDEGLRQKSSRLILRRGDCAAELQRLAEETGSRRVHALSHYEPWWRNIERTVAQELDLQLHEGMLLLPPGCVRTSTGGLYQIYTPFARATMLHMPPPEPQPAPSRIDPPSEWPASDSLDDWDLRPTHPDWAAAFAKDWEPGERL